MAPFFALFSLFFCSFFFLFQKPFFRNTSREPCRFGVDFGSPRWRLGCLLDASWSLLGTSWILGTSWVPLGCLLVPLGGLLGVPSGLFGVSGGLLGPLGCLLDASWSLLGASWVSVGFSGGSLGASWVLLGDPWEPYSAILKFPRPRRAGRSHIESAAVGAAPLVSVLSLFVTSCL